MSGASWIFQGKATTNNSALTFNLYDTLNLICYAYGAPGYAYSKLIFIISKGTIPTNATYTPATTTLTVNNVGTLIYSDIDGLQSGYENFIIFSTPYLYSTLTNTFDYDLRYVNVGTLKTTDSATYHCSAHFYDSAAPEFMTSGGLTITVNTKSGQAHSSRAQVNSMLTYSAAIIGASKLLF